MQTFSVTSCLNSGLVITRHNEIHDDIIHLTKKYFSPNCVHRKTLIHQGRIRSEKKVRQRWRVPETLGDVSIRGLLENTTEEIIDVRFGIDDAYSWKPVRMDKLLSVWEKLKKDKHRLAFYDQRRHVSPFVL